MSDFNYTLTKDAAKAVPLYHHEQVPFHSFSRPTSTNNNTSNVNLMSTTTSPLMTSNMKQEQQPNPISGDLQDIIYSYQSQPELLRLILLSKLEEDKRRAEEAKLRAKELDLLLVQQQQQQQQQQPSNEHDTAMPFPNNNNNNTNTSYQNQTYNNSFTMHPTPPMSTNSSTDGRMYHHMRRTSLDAILASPTHCAPAPILQQQQQQQQQGNHRRDSTLGSSFTGSADSDEFDDRTFSPIPTSTTTTTTTPVSASSLLQMDRYFLLSRVKINIHHY